MIIDKQKLADKWVAIMRKQISDSKKNKATKTIRLGFSPSILQVEQSDPSITTVPA